MKSPFCHPVIVAGILLLTLTGCAGMHDDRGHDPWVFRSVLDWNPRMLVMAPADDVWLAYHTPSASLYRVWSDGVSFEGPVYNQSHGPQPVSLGDAFLVGREGGSWSVRSDGHQYAPEVEYRGHEFSGDDVLLEFDLILNDGTSVRVTEAPELSGGRTLRRTFAVEGLPDETTVVLAIDGASLKSGDSYSTDGDFTIVEQADHSVSGNLVLNDNATTFFEFEFVDEPQVHTVVVPPDEQADNSDDRHPGLTLIEQADCSICHNTDVQTVGPSYMAIAERYVNSSYNISRLGRKIISGASGTWGDAVMTPHPDLTPEEAAEMTAYILSLDGEDLAESRPLGATDSYPLDGFGINNELKGVVVNAYRYADRVSAMPESVESTVPVFSGVAEGVYAVEDADFAGLSEDFYLEVVGNINIESTDNYTFRLISDDGAIMEINGSVVINNDGLHGPRPVDGELYLEAGKHPFRIRYFQAGGGKALALQWVRHGEEIFARIPGSVFSYSPDDLKETEPFVEPEKIIPGIPGDGIALRSVHPAFDLETIRPDDFQPMVGGLDVTDDGRVFVSTWDPSGSVYLVDNIGGTRDEIRVTQIAHGLLEPLGLKVVGDDIYVLQKHELTRLVDVDGDQIIDRYETVCDDWGVSSNFHEFAFGLAYADGFLYAALATAILPGGASAQPQVPDRGRVIKIDPEDGSYEFVAHGLRTPNGIGSGVDGELFVSDNQGDWLPSSKIMHVSPGAFFGSRSVDFDGTAALDEKQPVVWLPQDEIGNSPSQPALLSTGPYAGQMIHGEVTHGGIKRVFVEQVDGEYQGAVFRFVQGLEAGVNRLVAGSDGKLYVGGIGNPGNWGQTDKNWFGLQRLTYNESSVFEMLAVRAMRDGLEIEFTEPIADEHHVSPGDFEIRQWKYVPTAEYGGPKVGEQRLPVSELHVSNDRLRVFLEIDGLAAGSVVYIYLNDLFESQGGNSLWSTEAWYTLNRIPADRSGFRNTAVVTDPGLNRLTEDEREAGWELLFDGRSTDGWMRYEGGAPGAAWRVGNGALALGGDMEGWQTADGGDIVTEAEFGDFELTLEWKISPGGNSGIFYNVVMDTSRFSYPWESGPEMQILDDARHSDGRYKKHRSGDLYDMREAAAIATRPVGVWNRVRIIQDDGRVEHWLNGKHLLTYTTSTEEWTELIAGSKFAEMAGFGQAATGRIGLQDHGNPVFFRNIKIRRLD